jgi:cytochrome c-type biogenesis protein CcmH
MLWLIFATMTVVVILILLAPFLFKRSGDMARRVEYDVVVYRDQLAEIDQEIERGVLTDEQASAARSEVHRRMLAAEDAELKAAGKPARGDGRIARIAFICAIVIVPPVGAVLLYGMLGSPHLPGMAYAWRVKNDPQFTAIAGLADEAAKVQKHPTMAGYQQLADAYFAARNYPQAVEADRHAIELGATDAASWSELGEAEVMANDAVVPEALMAFTKALSLDSRSERARFYIGLAESQIGNRKQAVAIWRDLEQTSPPDAPWLPMVRDHIASVSKDGGFDPASVPPSPPNPTAMAASLSAMGQAMQAPAAGGDASGAPPGMGGPGGGPPGT